MRYTIEIPSEYMNYGLFQEKETGTIFISEKANENDTLFVRLHTVDGMSFKTDCDEPEMETIQEALITLLEEVYGDTIFNDEMDVDVFVDEIASFIPFVANE